MILLYIIFPPSGIDFTGAGLGKSCIERATIYGNRNSDIPPPLNADIYSKWSSVAALFSPTDIYSEPFNLFNNSIANLNRVPSL